MEDNGFVIKNIETNEYYIGFEKWDKQLRKAKIYHSIKYANDVINDSEHDSELKIVKIIIKEL